MKPVLIASLLLASCSVFADSGQDEYLGASIDLVRHGLKLGDSTLPAAKSEQKHDVGYSLKAGFYSSPNVAWELEYADSGKTSKHFERPGSPDDKLNGKIRSFSISTKVQLPVNEKINVYGKLGVTRLEGRQTFNSTVLPQEVLIQKAQKLVPLFGVGADIKLNDNLRAFTELTQTGKLDYGDNSPLPSDTQQVRRLSAGITYHY